MQEFCFNLDKFRAQVSVSDGHRLWSDSLLISDCVNLSVGGAGEENEGSENTEYSSNVILDKYALHDNLETLYVIEAETLPVAISRS